MSQKVDVNFPITHRCENSHQSYAIFLQFLSYELPVTFFTCCRRYPFTFIVFFVSCFLFLLFFFVLKNGYTHTIKNDASIYRYPFTELLMHFVFLILVIVCATQCSFNWTEVVNRVANTTLIAHFISEWSSSSQVDENLQETDCCDSKLMLIAHIH